MKYETLVPSAQWLSAAAAAAHSHRHSSFSSSAAGESPQVCERNPPSRLRHPSSSCSASTAKTSTSTTPPALSPARSSARPPTCKPLATQDIKRDIDYGLAFYRNESLTHYSTDGVPAGEHLLVIPTREANQLDHSLAGRLYEPLFLYDSQGLEVYRVYAAQQ